jgi:hypothetical protein
VTYSEDPAKPAVTTTFAGPAENGFLLPNGWRLTPAGRQVVLTDLPLNIVTSPDSRYAFVANPLTDYTQIYNEAYYRGEGADPLLDYVFEYLCDHGFSPT